MPQCTHTHTHTRTQTRTHTRANTHTHTHTHTHTRLRKRAFTSLTQISSLPSLPSSPSSPTSHDILVVGKSTHGSGETIGFEVCVCDVHVSLLSSFTVLQRCAGLYIHVSRIFLKVEGKWVSSSVQWLTGSMEFRVPAVCIYISIGQREDSCQGGGFSLSLQKTWLLSSFTMSVPIWESYYFRGCCIEGKPRSLVSGA